MLPFWVQASSLKFRQNQHLPTHHRPFPSLLRNHLLLSSDLWLSDLALRVELLFSSRVLSFELEQGLPRWVWFPLVLIGVQESLSVALVL
jgi:hypothetical protein